MGQYGSVWVSMGQYGSIWVSVGPFLPLGSVRFVEEGERKLHCCEYDYLLATVNHKCSIH